MDTEFLALYSTGGKHFHKIFFAAYLAIADIDAIYEAHQFYQFLAVAGFLFLLLHLIFDLYCFGFCLCYLLCFG